MLPGTVVSLVPVIDGVKPAADSGAGVGWVRGVIDNAIKVDRFPLWCVWLESLWWHPAFAVEGLAPIPFSTNVMPSRPAWAAGIRWRPWSATRHVVILLSVSSMIFECGIAGDQPHGRLILVAVVDLANSIDEIIEVLRPYLTALYPLKF